MEIHWQVTQDDIVRLRNLVEEQADQPLVRERFSRNLAAVKPKVEKSQFWRRMVGMRLTSMQPSGPNSRVAKFIAIEPFPLELDSMVN